MLKTEADVVRVIMDRGEEFSPGEAIAVQNRFAGQVVPQDDGGEAVPQLQHIEDLKYRLDQQELVAEEIWESRRPQLRLQPLFISQAPKCAQLQFPYETPVPEMKDGPARMDCDSKPFFK